jgi:hypothetical protein
VTRFKLVRSEVPVRFKYLIRSELTRHERHECLGVEYAIDRCGEALGFSGHPGQVKLFNESGRCGPDDVPVLCGPGLRGDLPQDAALAIVQMPFGSAHQAHLRYAVTGTKRLHDFDLASRAALDANGVDAGELVTRGCNKGQDREHEPDVPPEHGAQSHVKAVSLPVHSDRIGACVGLSALSVKEALFCDPNVFQQPGGLR